MAILETIAARASSSDTPNYELGYTLTYENKTYDSKETSVTIKPCLRHKKGVTRYRHHWDVRFTLDGKVVGTYANRILPINNVGTDVINAGKFYMKANEWYYWGEPYTLKIPNDGKQHKLGVWMRCLHTTPWYCPNQNDSLYIDVTTPLYNPTAPEPHGLYTAYYIGTSTLVYKWATTPKDGEETGLFNRVHYLQIRRTMYRDNGTVYGTADQLLNAEGRTDFKIYNTDLGKVKEVIPNEVAYVEWTVTNYSLSGGSSTSEVQTTTIPKANEDCSVWIKTDAGIWKKAIPWVKTPTGIWKKAIKAYCKANDAWKRTTT